MLAPGESVFFADTAEGALDRAAVVREIATKLGLSPITYAGVKLAHENSVTAGEMRRSLRNAAVMILHIGPPTFEDNYALSLVAEVHAAYAPTILLYVSDDKHRTMLDGLSIVGSVLRTPALSDFETAVSRDLAALTTANSNPDQLI